MKLAAPIRRHFRRPPRLQQQAGFFAKESEGPAFFQPSSEPRMKEDPSFFSAKEPEEQEIPAAKAPEEEEPIKSKAPEEEEPVKSKAPEEEEPVKAKGSKDEVTPVAAKCACGCGGAGTCVKSPDSSPEREQAKAPATQTSAATSSSPARGGHYDCSPAQENAAASAASRAGSLARRAQQAVGEVASTGDEPESAATGHYERWFGKIDARRAQLVRDTFGAIASSLGGTLHFHCDSEKNVYAYVRSCGKKEIYLGKLFWSRAGGTGIDSRAGVILHEMAHDVSRLVGDHSYGVADAQDLAMENPERAIRSADNYEYFAESL
jgi:Lysine-specific metallo-endopeptidase